MGPLVFLCLLYGGCKEEHLEGDTYFGGKVMVLGHGGMGLGYIMPENTYESVKPAVDIGCDGCEIDVQISRDSVLVAYHDYDLPGKTSCVGRIIDFNWSAIRVCQYKSAPILVQVYSLDDLFSRFDNLQDLYFSLDCKLESGRADQQEYEYRFMRAIKRLCEKYGMEDHVMIEGTSPFLDKAIELGMKNKLFLYTENEPDPVAPAKNKYAGILHNEHLPAEDILRAHQNGLYVMLGAAGNYSENKACVERGADIIQSDDPRTLLRLLRRYNYEYVRP